MADYSAEQVSAYNDIANAGAAIIFRRKATGTYNPVVDVDVAAEAQLNGAIDNVVTALVLQSIVGTFTSTGVIWVDREKMYYGALAGLNMSSITRGYGGTEPRAHLDLASVYLEADAAYTDYSSYAVITECKDRQADGTTIQLGDKVFLVPAYNLSIVPETSDTILVGGTEYVISLVQSVSPSNDPIIYKVFTRPK